MLKAATCSCIAIQAVYCIYCKKMVKNNSLQPFQLFCIFSKKHKDRDREKDDKKSSKRPKKEKDDEAMDTSGANTSQEDIKT